MSEKWRWPMGRFKGVLITRTPAGYLQWAVNHLHQVPHVQEKAKAELVRRQIITPNIELSAHSINRASQRLLRVWEAENTGEGLYNWLVRKAEAALDNHPSPELPDNMRVEHNGIVYIFDMRFVIPVLATVYVKGQNESED